MDVFLSSFKPVWIAFIKIFIFGFAGYLSLKFKLLKEESLKDMSKLLVSIIFPCFIFSNIITKFRPQEFSDWWVFPLLQLMLFGIALGVGWILLKASPRLAEKREFLSLTTFQNGSFLPIPLVAALFPHTADKYYIYIFLFVLFWPAVFYSCGVLLISKKKWEMKNLKDIFNPPFVTIAVSILLVMAGFHKYVPTAVLDPVEILGNCTIPLAMILLGGLIYLNFQYKCHLAKATFLKLAAGKLIILPLIAFGIIRFLGLSSDAAFIFFMQAAMPPALTLAIVARAYDGDYRFLGQSIFYLYICSIFTVPFFLSVYKVFIGW